ncbi:MAG: hypothetical protein WCG99_01070 [Candidatus Berkelbacteria bacterium]
MGKRTKLILGIILGAIIVFSGALFGLAKYGIIDLKGFADPLYGRVEITVDASNTGGGISLYKGTTPISVTGSFVGNVYTITSLAYGSYTYKFGMPGPNGQPCLGPTANLSHNSTTTRTIYTRFTCEGGGGGADTQQYWVLTGKVTSSTGTALSGALVSISDKNTTTNYAGEYTIAQIPIPISGGTANIDTLKNQVVSVSKTGYLSSSKKLIDIFAGITTAEAFALTSPHSYNLSLVSSGDTPPTPVFDQTKFSLLGAITDKDGKLVDGVTVTVSCNDADQSPGVDCGSVTKWTATSKADYQTYYPGLPADKKFNYEVKDIDAFKDYTVWPRLEVRYTKNGYFYDSNRDGLDNDGDAITIVQKPTSNYSVDTNTQKYLSFSNAVVGSRQYFTITGKIYKTLGGLSPAGNIRVNLSCDEDQSVNNSALTSDTINWPLGYSPASQIGNYAIENIPLNTNCHYKIHVKSLDARLTYLDTASSEFSGSGISFNSTYNRLLVITPVISLAPTNLIEIVHFKDAMTGGNIDMSKEEITENILLCYDADNENCVSGEPEILLNTIKYQIDQGMFFSTLQLKIETKNYTSLSNSMFITAGEATVYLIPITSLNFIDDLSAEEAMGQIDQALFDCRLVELVKFCTYKANGGSLFTPAKITQMTSYAKIVKAMSSLVGVDLPRYIFMWPSGYETPLRGFTLGLPNMPIFLSEAALSQNIGYNSVSVLIHEFGHYVFYNSPKFDSDALSKINSAYDLLMNDSGACVQALSPRYTCFSYYGASQAGEFFAEFFQWWVQNTDELNRLINDSSLNAPDLNHCKNSIMMLDQLLQEKFPKMKRFERVVRRSSSDSNDHVAGATSTDDENVTFFVNLMSSLGLKIGQNHIYNKISPLDNVPLTKDQISKGLWLQENYNDLSAANKSRILLSIQVQQAENLIRRYGSLTTVSIRNSLIAINNRVEKLLVSLGFSISNTKISGYVKDQDGAVAGMQINFSGKSDISGADGWYSISRTKSGTLPITLSNPKINKSYENLMPKTATLSPNQTKNVDINFTRQKYTLSGTVMAGEAPLKNGTITVYGGQSYNLDASGKFSFKIKEGRYRLIIKNKNGRTMSVTNAALYGDLKAISVIKDLSSIIWVK